MCYMLYVYVYMCGMVYYMCIYVCAGEVVSGLHSQVLVEGMVGLEESCMFQ